MNLLQSSTACGHPASTGLTPGLRRRSQLPSWTAASSPIGPSRGTRLTARTSLWFPSQNGVRALCPHRHKAITRRRRGSGRPVSSTSSTSPRMIIGHRHSSVLAAAGATGLRRSGPARTVDDGGQRPAAGTDPAPMRVAARSHGTASPLGVGGGGCRHGGGSRDRSTPRRRRRGISSIGGALGAGLACRTSRLRVDCAGLPAHRRRAVRRPADRSGRPQRADPPNATQSISFTTSILPPRSGCSEG